MTNFKALYWVGALLLIVALILSFSWLQPPSVAGVIGAKERRSGGPESTVMLRSRGECLIVSRNADDIDRKEITDGVRSGIFTIAVSPGMESGNDAQGPFIRQLSDGSIVRAGDALDGEVFFWPTPISEFGGLEKLRRFGWLIDDRCAGRVAELHSISRVH